MNEDIKAILNNMVTVKNFAGTTNQFKIETNDYILLQSYDSPVVMVSYGAIYIWDDAFFSTTTGKYRNMFLNETKKETVAKLKTGEYIAVDFNPEDL